MHLQLLRTLRYWVTLTYLPSTTLKAMLFYANILKDYFGNPKLSSIQNRFSLVTFTLFLTIIVMISYLKKSQKDYP